MPAVIIHLFIMIWDKIVIKMLHYDQIMAVPVFVFIPNYPISPLYIFCDGG